MHVKQMETPGNKKRILILDNNPRRHDAFDNIFFSDRWETFTTFDAEAILDTAAQLKPALIILDYLLVISDCEQICQDIKSDSHLRSIPLLVVTPFKTKLVKTKAYICDALFIKPHDVELMALTMDRYLTSMN